MSRVLHRAFTQFDESEPIHMQVVGPSHHVLAVHVDYKNTRSLYTLRFPHHLLSPPTNLTTLYQLCHLIPTLPPCTEPATIFQIEYESDINTEEPD